MDQQWQLGEPFHRVLPQCDDLLRRRHPAQGAGADPSRPAPRRLLFVGHSENFTESRDLFKLRGKTIYERV